jgi:hypothetical protein
LFCCITRQLCLRAIVTTMSVLLLHYCSFYEPALSDLTSDSCLDAYGVLKTVAVVVAAAGAASRGRGKHKRKIDRVSCISRRTFSLLTLIVQPVSPMCARTRLSHGCRFCGLLGVATPRLSSRHCSKSGRSPSYVSLGTPGSGVHPPQLGQRDGCRQCTQV